MGPGCAICKQTEQIVYRTKGWVFQIQAGKLNLPEESQDWAARTKYGLEAVRDIVGKVWLYVVLGIAVGARNNFV